ncbi:MAG: DUF2309 domain-containing protein, partial [Bacteroidia bacterium]|nr:DUF2309 domain-containing protein [Bacteroidia bacterium]
HNTLHAFQNMEFDTALSNARQIFGYNTLLTIEEYRKLYSEKKINQKILMRIISEQHPNESSDDILNRLLHEHFDSSLLPRVGELRQLWKLKYHTDLDNLVHPLLFRILCSYLDQGISMWNFPVPHKGLIASLREIEKESVSSLFKSERAKYLLLHTHCKLHSLLKILVGDEKLYERYLFDQQFAHAGWSGLVATIEEHPETLLDTKHITLHDLITLELLMEIDALDYKYKEKWPPLSSVQQENEMLPLFSAVATTPHFDALLLWQKAYEWSYYDDVLKGIQLSGKESEISEGSFQAMFCIDDRECSIRRHIEAQNPSAVTYGTPGFFNVAFFYQPEHGKFHTKLCPAPVTPKHLIKETGSKHKHEKDYHLAKQSHHLLTGWIISQTLGFWSALRLFFNIFKPTMSPATATSLRHMDQFSTLTIENKSLSDREQNLQIGFAIEEMATQIEGLLKSIGLITDFAPLVYVIGHGSSSVNNPHYAAYDCGACSGRPGSVNARVAAFMANHKKVRELLKAKGIIIPASTSFVAALHDTTRDEIVFYDEETLSEEQRKLHLSNKITFEKVLNENAKERSRRFEVIDTRKSAEQIHEKIKTRSVSLFEPRPELNHATNALCIVGRRSLTRQLFLDRRAFMNSYDYRIDPDGKYLLNILQAAAPVCGGINLEYFFSSVDNQKLGAGSKLPHNVMGLIGVANGIDGDLRPGLPSQMIEVHNPIRLLMIVEQFPEVLLKVIQQSAETYEWFIHEWVTLIAVNPETGQQYRFSKGSFEKYTTSGNSIPEVSDFHSLIESTDEDIPVHLFQHG